MKTYHPPDTRRRWFPIGPGLIFALIIAALGAVGLCTRHAPPNAGNIVWEADAQGRLRRVNAPTNEPIPVPRLWKPEVGVLLAHGSELRLDARQSVALNKLNENWLREKAMLEQEIKQVTSDTHRIFERSSAEHGVSVTQVAHSLGDYSAFSQRYNQRRAVYWTQAVAILSGGQRQRLNKIEEEARKPQ